MLPFSATAAGTEPDSEISPAVVELLRIEGIDVAHLRPRRPTHQELAAASHIISMGCDVADLARPGMVIEHWDDVPPPSQDLFLTRDEICIHVEQLIETLRPAALDAPEHVQGVC